MFTGSDSMFRKGNNPLQNAVMDAIIQKNTNLITSFLGKYDINAINKNGYTCLDLARSCLNPQFNLDVNVINNVILLIRNNNGIGAPGKTFPAAIENNINRPKFK